MAENLNINDIIRKQAEINIASANAIGSRDSNVSIINTVSILLVNPPCIQTVSFIENVSVNGPLIQTVSVLGQVALVSIPIQTVSFLNKQPVDIVSGTVSIHNIVNTLSTIINQIAIQTVSFLNKQPVDIVSGTVSILNNINSTLTNSSASLTISSIIHPVSIIPVANPPLLGLTLYSGVLAITSSSLYDLTGYINHSFYFTWNGATSKAVLTLESTPFPLIGGIFLTTSVLNLLTTVTLPNVSVPNIKQFNFTGMLKYVRVRMVDSVPGTFINVHSFHSLV